MTKPDYAALDAAILAALADGPLPFSALSAHPTVKSEAASRAGFAPGWRAIDRRLQALRKLGRIVPDRLRGWSLAEGGAE